MDRLQLKRRLERDLKTFITKNVISQRNFELNDEAIEIENATDVNVGFHFQNIDFQEALSGEAFELIATGNFTAQLKKEGKTQTEQLSFWFAPKPCIAKYLKSSGNFEFSGWDNFGLVDVLD
jgi:hypothetical protein